MQQIALNDLSRHLAPQREALMQAIARVVDSGWFVLGPELAAFEHEFAAYCGVEHAMGVANGTDAIELALRALGVAAGDEVILAANAGMYSTTALRAIGAALVYVDVDDRHLVLHAAGVEAALTSRTRAVIATHLYGRMAQMKPLRDLANRANIALVEDCAQAHGASQSGQRAGTWGDAAAFSFYPTKNLGALGDAGMVTCGKSALADRVRRLRQYGWDKKYISIEGHARNSRLDEMQAAVLRVMLPLVDAWNARRREIAGRYSAVAHANLHHPDTHGDDYVAHLYVVRTAARDSLREHLTASGIGSDIHYPLLDTQQPALQGPVAAPTLPVSALAATQVLSLPCYPELTDTEVERVCAALAAWRP
jgi:dTDP-3-amino-2,3,6-trideoxy-4-keto-D-glucose/dTDP-3-amino-3,4,6-trideoxy-alpha-D-glucose/dTDP-2,6-dideoxy-D-kanosamine transaminase